MICRGYKSELSPASFRPDWHPRPAFIDFGAPGTTRPTCTPATAGKQGRLIGGYRTGTNVSCYCDAIRDSRIATDFRQKLPMGALAANGFFDCGSRKSARRSSILLPLLQRSLGDL